MNIYFKNSYFLDNIIVMENYDVQLSTFNSKNSKMDYNK